MLQLLLKTLIIPPIIFQHIILEMNFFGQNTSLNRGTRKLLVSCAECASFSSGHYSIITFVWTVDVHFHRGHVRLGFLLLLLSKGVLTSPASAEVTAADTQLLRSQQLLMASCGCGGRGGHGWPQPQGVRGKPKVESNGVSEHGFGGLAMSWEAQLVSLGTGQRLW